MDVTQSSAGAAFISELEPFRKAQGKTLTAVLRRDYGEGEELTLAFGSERLLLRCDEVRDAVQIKFGGIELVDDIDDLTADAPWSRFIGKEFFWGWLTINPQGFADGVLLSFDGVVPELGLNVVASTFEVLEIRHVAS